jgi:hypothetical protein
VLVELAVTVAAPQPANATITGPSNTSASRRTSGVTDAAFATGLVTRLEWGKGVQASLCRKWGRLIDGPDCVQ